MNEEIRAPELRVIGEDGKQVGLLDRSTALAKAREVELDLIEIAPGAKPPVAKIADLGKYIYQEEKKKKAGARKSKGGEVKEIRLSPFIAENDYNTRLERVKEFLKEKNKVKLTVVFKGRQMGSRGFGYDLLGKTIKDLGETIHVDMEPKFIGRHLIMTISPVTKSAKPKEEVEVKEKETK
ncbi:MAG TPA: translation initiation factor IF-3 [Patescibacteria group bacterium]